MTTGRGRLSPFTPHGYHLASAECTCGRNETETCPDCFAHLCSHCKCTKVKTVHKSNPESFWDRMRELHGPDVKP